LDISTQLVPGICQAVSVEGGVLSRPLLLPPLLPASISSTCVCACVCVSMCWGGDVAAPWLITHSAHLRCLSHLLFLKSSANQYKNPGFLSSHHQIVVGIAPSRFIPSARYPRFTPFSPVQILSPYPETPQPAVLQPPAGPAYPSASLVPISHPVTPSPSLRSIAPASDSIIPLLPSYLIASKLGLTYLLLCVTESALGSCKHNCNIIYLSLQNK